MKLFYFFLSCCIFQMSDYFFGVRDLFVFDVGNQSVDFVVVIFHAVFIVFQKFELSI